MDFVVSFLMGWLEGPVMFLQDNWGSFFLFLGLPLAVCALVNGRLEDKSRFLQRFLKMIGLLLWMTIVIIRDFFPEGVGHWRVVGLMFWFFALYTVAVMERSDFERSGEHDSAGTA